MKIETKYEIGQRIWVVYADRGEVCIYDDYIGWISVDKEGLTYGLEEACDDKKEEDIILYNDKEKLLKKIEETMKQIRKKEGKK